MAGLITGILLGMSVAYIVLFFIKKVKKIVAFTVRL